MFIGLKDSKIVKMTSSLQVFIEQNAGKDFGDKYLFENVFINTRFSRATEPHLVEVCLHLPWINFSDCFDSRKIRNNIDFHKWLVNIFFPLAKEKISEALR